MTRNRKSRNHGAERRTRKAKWSAATKKARRQRKGKGLFKWGKSN